jgi:hypothetical protein
MATFSVQTPGPAAHPDVGNCRYAPVSLILSHLYSGQIPYFIVFSFQAVYRIRKLGDWYALCGCVAMRFSNLCFGTDPLGMFLMENRQH